MQVDENGQAGNRRLRDALLVVTLGLGVLVGFVRVEQGEPAAAPPLVPIIPTVEAEPMPETAIDEPLPDFSAFDDARKKKQAFFDYLQPLVEHHNQRLLEEREQLRNLAAKLEAGDALAPAEQQTLAEFARRYRVELKPGKERQAAALLLRRVDVVPISLALIQSANESGWGTSRFAREANNLFGEKCFRQGCGIAPARRQGGTEYARFDAPADAVASYMHNLNTNPAYLDFRKLREQLREQEQPITGPAVADGLHRYSVRGEDYVRELRSMILRNRLHRIDEALTELDAETAPPENEAAGADAGAGKATERLRVAACLSEDRLRC